LKTVRHALFEKMNAGSVDKWSDAHKLAIKRAVFQAWDVALPLLGPTKEERMVQLQKDIALGLKQNDQTPEKMLKIKEMQAELEAEEDTENALSVSYIMNFSFSPLLYFVCFSFYISVSLSLCLSVSQSLCVHVCMCACVHVCMCACVHVCM
jgi:hypothetical protein